MNPMTVSIAVGVLATIAMPSRAFAGIEGSLLTFAGVIIASVVPTMALLATILRAGRRSVQEVGLLGRAMLEQFDFWVGVLAVALWVSLALLLGNLLGWKTVSLAAHVGRITYRFDPAQVLNGAVAAGLTLLMFKGRPFVEGFRSLLALHVEQVKDDARDAFEARHEEATMNFVKRADDPDFGEFVKH